MSEDEHIVRMTWNCCMRKYNKRIFAISYV